MSLRCGTETYVHPGTPGCRRREQPLEQLPEAVRHNNAGCLIVTAASCVQRKGSMCFQPSACATIFETGAAWPLELHCVLARGTGRPRSATTKPTELTEPKLCKLGIG